MYLKIYYSLVALLFLTARGDPDPQTFIASTHRPLFVSPLQQPQYQDKIVYLTPEQITALQTGQAVLEPELEPQSPPEEEKQNQEQLSQYELEQEIDQNDFIGNQRFVIVQNQNEPAPVQEPSQEEPQGLSRYSSESGDNRYRTSETEIKKYNAPTQKQLENKRHYNSLAKIPEGIEYNEATSKAPEELDLKSYNYYNVYNQKKGDNISIKIIHPNPKDKLREVLGVKKVKTQQPSALNKDYKFVPYVYTNKKLSENVPVQESANIERNRPTPNIKERQYTLLYIPSQSAENQEPQENEQEDSSENEQNNEEDANESIQNKRKQILDLLKKQNARAEAANFARLSLANKKVSITKQVSVPKSYLVRVPQPIEDKLRQPYNVRLVPLKIEDNEKEVEKTVRVPATKKVYVKVNKPSLLEKIEPVESRTVQRPQILRILEPYFNYYE